MSYERQSLALEYIKTAAIILGIIFALAELRDADRSRIAERFGNTSQMIQGFASPDVVTGAAALLSAIQAPPSSKPWEILLVELTPYRQHLITWSACVQFENCEMNRSVEYLCRSLMTYEGGMKIVYAKYSKNYNYAWRDESYFGQHSECKTSYPSMATQIEDGIKATLAHSSK